jgi:protein gp37
MAEDSKIQWCDHTWSPWRGCTKVSAGCKNCYAEKISHRNPAVLGEWGPDGARVVNADWRKPLAWDRKAAKAGTRLRVFPSLCDWLEDRPDLDEPLGRFLELIARTPDLDWLLLTKRPELFSDRLHAVVRNYHGGGHELERGLSTGDMIASAWLDGATPANVWLGTSTEDQPNADARIPALLEIPAAVRFVSAEPLLGPVDFTNVAWNGWRWNVLTGEASYCGVSGGPENLANRIDWVIVGGESGPQARPCDVAWVRSLRDQCRAAGVPCFVKQLGARPVGNCTDCTLVSSERLSCRYCTKLADPKGGDPAEWTADLRVREMPRAAATTTPDVPHPDARDPWLRGWAKLGAAR